MLVSKVLKWFEVELPQAQFVRVNRTHLLNASYMQKGKTNNNHYFQLPDGSQIKVPRRKQKKLLLQVA
jgi:DNA-binding LytR/AlgR family response regulator